MESDSGFLVAFGMAFGQALEGKALTLDSQQASERHIPIDIDGFGTLE